MTKLKHSLDYLEIVDDFYLFIWSYLLDFFNVLIKIYYSLGCIRISNLKRDLPHPVLHVQDWWRSNEVFPLIRNDFKAVLLLMLDLNTLRIRKWDNVNSLVDLFFIFVKVEEISHKDKCSFAKLLLSFFFNLELTFQLKNFWW